MVAASNDGQGCIHPPQADLHPDWRRTTASVHAACLGWPMNLYRRDILVVLAGILSTLR